MPSKLPGQVNVDEIQCQAIKTKSIQTKPLTGLADIAVGGKAGTQRTANYRPEKEILKEKGGRTAGRQNKKYPDEMNTQDLRMFPKGHVVAFGGQAVEEIL